MLYGLGSLYNSQEISGSSRCSNGSSAVLTERTSLDQKITTDNATIGMNRNSLSSFGTGGNSRIIGR